MHHVIKGLAWIFIALCALTMAVARPGGIRARSAGLPTPSSEDEANWFTRLKPYCNSVEVATRLQGDDRSAGPMMELVVEFWPNHYMALYHAGASEYQLKQFDKARSNLDTFMRLYDGEDGWKGSARSMLSQTKNGKTPSAIEVLR